MATDATGTPTTLGIPRFDVANDAPSGLGFNAAMAEIDTLLQTAPLSGSIAGIATGSVPVWNGSAWVKPSGTPDGTKFLRDDGAWAAPASSEWTHVVKPSDESVASSAALQADDHLLFQTTAGKTYEVVVGLIYLAAGGSAGDPGLWIVFGEDTVARGAFAVQYINTSDVPSVGQMLLNATSFTQLGTNPSERLALFHGYYRGNGSTFVSYWGQLVSNALATTVKAQSFLRYRAVN